MKIWRTLLRVILILLAVGLVLLVAYGLWRLFKRYWAPILFWGYCVVALLVFWMMYWFTLRLKRLDNPQGQEVFLHQVISATKETGRLQRWRNYASELTIYLAAALAWPLTFLFAFFQTRRLPAGSRTKHLSQLAQERLNPWEAQVAVALLLIVGGLFAAHKLFGPHEGFGRGLLLIVAAVCTAKLLAYAVNPVSLPAHLRRSPRSPYVSFVVIAVCLFAVLVLCFTGYTLGVPNVSYEHAKATAFDLIKFRKAFAFYGGEEIAPVDYFLTIAGFLYYITLFQTIRSFDKFKRTDEDMHALAQSYIMLGKFGEALKWLGKVQIKNQITHALRASAFLGSDELRKALDAAKKSYDLERDETLDENGGYYNVASIALVSPVPEEQITRLLDEWLKSGPREGSFIDALDSLFGVDKITPEAYGQLLGREGRAEKYPLLSCHQLLMAGEFVQARARLEALPPGAGIGELLRRIMLLKSDVLRPDTSPLEDAVALDEWVARHLAEVKDLGLSLTDDNDRVMAVFQVNVALISARSLASGRIEEINSLLQELKISIKAEDMRLKAERATQYIQDAVQTA